MFSQFFRIILVFSYVIFDEFEGVLDLFQSTNLSGTEYIYRQSQNWTFWDFSSAKFATGLFFLFIFFFCNILIIFQILNHLSFKFLISLL